MDEEADVWCELERRGDGARSAPLRGATVAAALAALAVTLTTLLGAAPASAGGSHTVESGETLSEIAERYGARLRAIAELNRIDDPDRILAGTTLRLPGSTGGEAGAPSGDAVRTHVVASGETLSGIAARYGVTVGELRELNGLLPSDPLMAGVRLEVEGTPPPRLTGTSGGSHRIERGETLSEIAARYGASLRAIAEMNRIDDPDRILAGATIAVPGGDGWRCPVDGSVRFMNDFGLVKPSGTRYHEGVDLYAPRGTPVVAPVSGTVEQLRGPRAGLQITLRGDDGHTYIGTHLDGFGEAGRVGRGTVVGYVGSTGNAIGTPSHLHFEIHAGGTRIINPYPTLVEACR